MANIDSQINDRMNAFSGNPQALMQRYAQTQELVDLLALQKMTNDRKAATAAVQSAMQPPTGTVKGQLEQEAMQGARNDVMRGMAPGIQQQGQRMAQMQNRAAMGLPTQGLPTQAAPNMARMAQGGIVGYAQGGMPKVGAQSKGPIPQLSPEENAQMLKYLEGLKKFDYYDKNPDKVSPEGRQALEADRRAFEAQFPNSFRQKVSEMMYGPSKGMAMGGIVGYQQGGDVKRFQEGMSVIGDDEDEPIIPLGALFELIGRGRDALFSPSRATQEAREIRRGEVEQAADRGVNLLNVLPPSQGLTPEQLASFDKVDVTGALPPRIVEQRRERVESGEAAKA